MCRLIPLDLPDLQTEAVSRAWVSQEGYEREAYEDVPPNRYTPPPLQVCVLGAWRPSVMIAVCKAWGCCCLCSRPGRPAMHAEALPLRSLVPKNQYEACMLTLCWTLAVHLWLHASKHIFYTGSTDRLS